jgi:hypothetical protein
LLELSEREDLVDGSELIRTLRSIAQVDWGDFALVPDDEKASQLRALDPVELVARCVVLVRAVDSAFLYLYGSPPPPPNSLRSLFVDATLKQGPLTELDFPD